MCLKYIVEQSRMNIDKLAVGSYKFIIHVKHKIDPFHSITSIKSVSFTTKEECTQHEAAVCIKDQLVQGKLNIDIPASNIKEIKVESFAKTINADVTV